MVRFTWACVLVTACGGGTAADPAPVDAAVSDASGAGGFGGGIAIQDAAAFTCPTQKKACEPFDGGVPVVASAAAFGVDRFVDFDGRSVLGVRGTDAVILSGLPEQPSETAFALDGRSPIGIVDLGTTEVVLACDASTCRAP